MHCGIRYLERRFGPRRAPYRSTVQQKAKSDLLGDKITIRGEKGTGEVEALLNIRRHTCFLKGDTHRFSDRHESIREKGEKNWVGRRRYRSGGRHDRRRAMKWKYAESDVVEQERARGESGRKRDDDSEAEVQASRREKCGVEPAVDNTCSCTGECPAPANRQAREIKGRRPRS